MRFRKVKTAAEKQRDSYYNNLTSLLFRELVNRYTQKMTELGRFEEIKFRTRLAENLEIPYQVFRNLYDTGIGQINYILMMVEKCNAIGVDVSEVFSASIFTKLGTQASKSVEEKVYVVDEFILPDM